MHPGFHKNTKQQKTVVFHLFGLYNILKKCFLSSKSAYYNDFWRSCDTDDCSNDAENTALITEINDMLH